MRTPPTLLIVGVLVASGPLASRPASANVIEERDVLGTTREGRAIRLFHRGDPSEAAILVVGCIHGDECVGMRIARRLRRGAPPGFAELYVVPTLNPDGRAERTRQNSRGVDLNRNFPYRWRPSARGRYYSGQRPASERETRIAMRLIEQVRPEITIWYHQPLALVDHSRPGARVERRYARLTRLPLRDLGRLHGTATSWQNHEHRGTTAFVVELSEGPLAPREVRLHARAVLALGR